jgi:hypothetical protein
MKSDGEGRTIEWHRSETMSVGDGRGPRCGMGINATPKPEPAPSGRDAPGPDESAAACLHGNRRHRADSQSNGSDDQNWSGRRNPPEMKRLNNQLRCGRATISLSPSLLGASGSAGSVIAKLSMSSHPARDAVAQATLADGSIRSAQAHRGALRLRRLPSWLRFAGLD